MILAFVRVLVDLQILLTEDVIVIGTIRIERGFGSNRTASTVGAGAAGIGLMRVRNEEHRKKNRITFGLVHLTTSPLSLTTMLSRYGTTLLGVCKYHSRAF